MQGCVNNKKCDQIMKKIIPAFIIAFVSSFMFFLYEPINMYACNINDFWFDLYIMIKPSMLMFLTFFFTLTGIYIIIYLINKKFSKKLYVYKCSIILGFILLFAFYIQGNFLIGSLPVLDGSKIEWNSYKIETIISIIIWAVIAIVASFTFYKFKYKKNVKIYSFISMAIFVMLTASLVSIMATHDTFIKKGRVLYSNVKNINTSSENKNLYILMLDTVDSKMFNEVVESGDYQNVFEDFTYYPDTMGAYAYTRNALPFVLSGIWDENKMRYLDYYNNAMDKSPLINKLMNKGYSINIYVEDFEWNTEKALNVSNMTNSMEINNASYGLNVLKYVLFKYIPYPFKNLAKIETLNFDVCRVPSEYDNFSWEDIEFYNNLIKNNELEKENQNNFQFIHLEGAHPYFYFDKDLNKKEDATYEDELEGCITVINAFINRLKDNNTYNNSAIVILGDHGYNCDNYTGKQNPILYIKGINEHHKMITSNLPISFEDLQEAFSELLEDKQSLDLFQNIDRNRKRRYLLYGPTTAQHMVEYEQTGTADNEDTLVPTGREFNR